MGDAVEIRRCQHIKVNGTQCGSPALRGERFCHFHRENQPARVKVNGAEGGEVLVPVFDDAQSIQTVVRQVAMLVLEGKIENKKAGLLLYALQIASTNLKRVEEEKPRPTQVVVDRESVSETPIGMTPWSKREGGCEPEDEEERFQGPLAAKLKREMFHVRQVHECRKNVARRLAKELRDYAKAGPETDFGKLKWSLCNIAGKIEGFAAR